MSYLACSITERRDPLGAESGRAESGRTKSGRASAEPPAARAPVPERFKRIHQIQIQFRKMQCEMRQRLKLAVHTYSRKKPTLFLFFGVFLEFLFFVHVDELFDYKLA